jgi:hypothetical protein
MGFFSTLQLDIMCVNGPLSPPFFELFHFGWTK